MFCKTKKINNQPNQQGQVGLVVLLVLVIVLALGISLATRTTQQAAISIQQEDTTRVFNAAEAGLEAALASIYQSEANNDIDNLSEANTELAFAEGNADINYAIQKSSVLEMHLKQGSSTEIDIPGAGNITFNWATETACGDTASLIISVYADNAGTVEARHYGVGNCNGLSTRGDNFIANNAGEAPYQYSYTIATSPDDLFLRVKPVYNDTSVSISGAGTVSQFVINSQAQSNTTGDETRTFEVKRTLSTAPAFMEYALVSGSSIIKN